MTRQQIRQLADLMSSPRQRLTSTSVILLLAAVYTAIISLLFAFEFSELRRDSMRNLEAQVAERAAALESTLAERGNYLAQLSREFQHHLQAETVPCYNSEFVWSPVDSVWILRFPNSENWPVLLASRRAPQDLVGEDAAELAALASLAGSIPLRDTGTGQYAWTYYISQHQMLLMYPVHNEAQLKHTLGITSLHEAFENSGFATRIVNHALVDTMQAGPQPFWSGAYEDRAGRGYMTTVKQRILLDEAFMGVLCLDLPLDQLTAFTSYSGAGKLMLVNQRRQLLGVNAELELRAGELPGLSELLPDFGRLPISNGLDIYVDSRQSADGKFCVTAPLNAAPFHLILATDYSQINLAVLKRMGRYPLALLLGVIILGIAGLVLLRMEGRLAERAQLFRAHFDLCPAGMALLGPEQTWLMVNARCEEMLGYTATELRRRKWCDMLVPEQQEECASNFGQLESGSETRLSALRHFVRADGNMLPIEVEVSVIRDSSGAPDLYIVYLQDVSRKLQLEAEHERTISELQRSLERLRTLQGLFPICVSCKKIRDDEGYWHAVEEYIQSRSEAEFSHAICPDCMKELYPDLQDDEDGTNSDS